MRRILTTLALTTALAAPAGAFEIGAMTDEEKAAFGEAVRDYLMANPEVLVESIGVLEQRQADQQVENDRLLVSTNAADLFEDGHSWIGGNLEGDVMLVEFVDYKCGYCRKAFPEIQKLVEEDGNIRLIMKEFPILGAQSELAGRFAVAVSQLHDDASYKTLHDTLITMRGDVTLESLSRVAEDQGLDPEPILKRMNEEEVTAVLRANAQLAERLRINGTPAFVLGTPKDDGIEGQLLRGYLPYEGMQAAVAETRG